MPYAVITATAPLTDDQRYRLHREVSRLLATILGKKAWLTSVRIEEAPAGSWSVGGRVENAAHLDVKITNGSNSEDEKRRFIAAAHDMLLDVLDELPLATYVVIDEVQAASWGYAGKTQADRAAAALAMRPATRVA